MKLKNISTKIEKLKYFDVIDPNEHFQGKKKKIIPKTSKKINKELNKKSLHKKKNDIHERTMMMMF
jgi:hypothetical protein